MPLEYFTEEEFREVAQDEDSPSKFDEADIVRAHDEVVKRLELWARTSWVTREWSMKKLVTHSYINLSRIPVQAITTFNLGGDAVAPGDYDLDAEGGKIVWGDWSEGVPLMDSVWIAELVWDYGFGFTDPADIDWDIKRPSILAAKSLLVPQKRPNKIPPNTRSYTTGRTSFDLRFERSQTKPWPWDEGMSSQLRAAWEPFRYRMYVS
jgi:hypothetical protein